MHANESRWPLFALLGISVAAFVVAFWQSALISGITYIVLLLASVVLFFKYRTDLVEATSSRQQAQYGIRISGLERGTVFAVVVGCLANGIIIGIWVSGWEMWF